MNNASLGISLAALVPALLLCAFVYYKDKTEKEPLWLLAILFACGAVVFFPALLLEQTLGDVIDSAFADKMIFSFDGRLSYASEGDRFAHLSIFTLMIAFVEESAKWLLLFFITRKNKNFNYLFDGIVYSTFISMGFAAVENVRFAVIDGWDTFFLRAVTSVPGHLFFGIFMGCCYTVWHTYSEAVSIEKDLQKKKSITERKFKCSALWLILSLALPVAVHMVYSFTESYGTRAVTSFYYVFVIALYVLCFFNINRMSGKDASNERIAYAWVLKKHLNIEKNITKLTEKLLREKEGSDE
ncbi:MAG: PrsW family intramembrane metalloprotease [Ruminococcaceae bacterium]|nr:PrsW family intramembrane metalloprotease [Oscillospiraceae bacterium]